MWVICIKNIYEITHGIWPTDPNDPGRVWPEVELIDWAEEQRKAQSQLKEEVSLRESQIRDQVDEDKRQKWRDYQDGINRLIRKSIESLRRDYITEYKSYINPPHNARVVARALCYMHLPELYMKKDIVGKFEVDWFMEIKVMMEDSCQFLEKCFNFHNKSMNPEVYSNLKEYVAEQIEHFDTNVTKTSSLSIHTLANWIIFQMNIFEARNHQSLTNSMLQESVLFPVSTLNTTMQKESSTTEKRGKEWMASTLVKQEKRVTSVATLSDVRHPRSQSQSEPKLVKN